MLHRQVYATLDSPGYYFVICTQTTTLILYIGYSLLSISVCGPNPPSHTPTTINMILQTLFCISYSKTGAAVSLLLPGNIILKNPQHIFAWTKGQGRPVHFYL